MNYTKEQEQAIFLRDKNIMVSAGAGAGKTRVLVSRMAELIMDEKNPVEADRFLVMTFTNAAAAEMKERISLDLEERLAKDPENLEKYMKQFVEIQLEIHDKTAPLLNKMKDKMSVRINSLKAVNATTRYELSTRLEGMPKHKKVLHGDYNPTNVVIDKDGKYYILDWSHATQGNASADAATTYLLLTLQDPKMAEMYMNMFCDMSDTAKQYVQRWLPIVAASRLTKAIPEEKDLLEKWLDVVEYE